MKNIVIIYLAAMSMGLIIGDVVTPQVVILKVPSALASVTPSLIAKELLTTKSYRCWLALTKAESHFNALAKNPNSSARGIGQLLTSTYTSLGMKHSADGTAQLVAQLAYINRHYGQPNSVCNAWKSEQRINSY
jgi:membrane-bound lytic murein transglycosylase MltF